MLRKFSDLKIQYQFFLLTMIAVMLVLAIQAGYYFKITSITREKIKSFTDQSISQVDETTKIIFEKTRNAATYFAYSSSVQEFMAAGDSFDKFQAKKQIDGMMKPAVEINNEIMNTVLIDPDGIQKYSYLNFERPVSDVLEGIQESIQKNDIGKGFMFFESENSTNEKFLVYVMMLRYIGGGIRNGKTLGSIVIFLNPDMLNQIINKAAKPENVEFYLLDHNEQIVASNMPKENESGAAEEKMLKLNKNSNIEIRKEVASTAWSIVALVNEREIVRDYAFFKSFAMFVGFVMILLLAGIGFIFNRSIAMPVVKLLNEIDKVGRENLKKRIKMSVKNEIGSIADNINRMLDNLEALSRNIFETQQKMYESELSRKQTELYALQSQVNPHFLFNTIQCIGGIALSRNLPEVVEAAASMADIFRYCIKGSDMVKVSDEVNIVRQYLKIIELRFAGEFRWEINIHQEMLEMKTIKMILQPLVENAVYHGFEKSSEEGTLKVSGWMEQDSILLEIWDNGPGIDKDILVGIQRMLSDMKELERESMKRQKIGIANIQWRIKLILGEEYGISVSSGKGEGTTIRVRLPITL